MRMLSLFVLSSLCLTALPSLAHAEEDGWRHHHEWREHNWRGEHDGRGWYRERHWRDEEPRMRYAAPGVYYTPAPHFFGFGYRHQDDDE